MAVAVNLATSKSYSALVLTEKALAAFNKFKQSKPIAEKLQSLRQERADRIKIKEKFRAIRKMELIEKLEQPSPAVKPRSNEQMQAFRDIGFMYFDLAKTYWARSRQSNEAVALLERHIENYFLSKAVKNIVAAAGIAQERKNLHLEIRYKKDVLDMLDGQNALTLKLYHIKAKLEKEMPALEMEYQNKISEYRPRRGN